MSGRRSLWVAPLVLLAGCASTPVEPRRSGAMTRAAYLEWRSAQLLRVEPRTRSFAEVVETPEGDWPGHLKGRTISFTALLLSIQDGEVAPVDSIEGRAVRVVALGDPDRSDRDIRLCLDAEDHAEDRFRYDNLVARSGEWRGTPVKVTAFMTGVPEDPVLSPWIGRILAVEHSESR